MITYLLIAFSCLYMAYKLFKANKITTGAVRFWTLISLVPYAQWIALFAFAFDCFVVFKRNKHQVL